MIKKQQEQIEKKQDMMQSVILTFSDGTKAIFSGRAIVYPGQCANLMVTAIKFTVPVPLPARCEFEAVDIDTTPITTKKKSGGKRASTSRKKA